jgi:hypothetical protein
MEAVLSIYACWEERERQLKLLGLVCWLIGLHLYPHLSQRDVFAKLVSGLRRSRDDVAASIPVKSAFSYRREQLGSEVLEDLFQQVAAQDTSLSTPGVSWKGWRLLCLDGTRESVPDTPANSVAFQYSTDNETVRSPFPQARLLLLIECGTHLIRDVEITECREGERSAAARLLARRCLSHSSRLWDCGFHSPRALFQVCDAGGQVLERLTQGMLVHPLVTLVDGSTLAEIWEDSSHRRGRSMLVRVISYRLDDLRLSTGDPQVYRLVTTLLDPFAYPAKEVAVLSHERWHAEVVIGETRTHLRLSARTLLSLTPQGVIQELWVLVLAHPLVRTLMLRRQNRAGSWRTASPSRQLFASSMTACRCFVASARLVGSGWCRTCSPN